MSEEFRSNQGISMTREEIDDFLRTQEYAILALADQNRAYAVPVCFGYDGEDIYLYLIRFGESSEKLSFRERTEQACLTTFKVDSKQRWRSVVVRGPLQEIRQEKKRNVEKILMNSPWFSTILPPKDPIREVRQFVLAIEELSGRKGEEFGTS